MDVFKSGPGAANQFETLGFIVLIKIFHIQIFSFTFFLLHTL